MTTKVVDPSDRELSGAAKMHQRHRDGHCAGPAMRPVSTEVVVEVSWRLGRVAGLEGTRGKMNGRNGSPSFQL